MSSFKALVTAILFSTLSSNLFAATLQELIASAESAEQQKAYSTALIHLKNAAREYPQDIQVRLKMAELFVHTGQGVQAEVEIDRANRLGATMVDTAVLSARAKLLLGQFEELTENIDFLELPQTQIARLRAIQGLAFYEQRKFSLAAQMFQRAHLLSPNELEVEIGQARLLFLEGKNEQEEKLVLSLLGRYPDQADVLILAGDFYRERGDYEKALELYGKAGEIQPSNVNIWFGVVRSHIARKNYNDAKIEIQKVLSSYPEHQVANYLLAVIAYEENDFDRAKGAIEIVLKGEKRKYEALKLLSTIQFQQKEYSEAEQNIKKYLAFNPGDVQALKTLAAIYLKRKQGVLALEVLNNLEQLDDAYIYSMIATAYMQLGNNEKSDFYIQKSMQTAPDDRVIQRHFQKSKLQAGETLSIQFTDTDFNDFIGEGHLPILNLLRLKDYTEAERIIRGYMAQMPKNGLLHYLLGSTYLYQGDLAKAEDEFKLSIEFNPDLIESRINLAKIYLQAGKERDAEREFREVLRLQKNNDQAMISLAGIYSRAGDEDEMLKWLNNSRKNNTASLASREVLEKYYREKGDLNKALDLSAEMVAIQPQNIRLLLRNANNQKALGRLDQAIRTFEKIVELKPDEAETWSAIGRLQFLDSKLNAARSSYQKVLELDPDNLIAKVILIQIDLKSNQADDALVKAEQMQKMHPDQSASYDMLGDVHIALNRPDKAIQDYRKSISFSKSSDTYLKLLSAYNRNNQAEKGFDLLKQWVKQYPAAIQLKEVLAMTYQQRGEYEKAHTLYEEIVLKARKNDRALNNLALVALELKSPMSIEYAEMAYNLDPDNIRHKDTLGWVLLNNHNPAKALKLLKEASDKAPTDADIRYHYAVGLKQTGENSQAIKQLFLALSSKGNFANRTEAQRLLDELRKNE